MFAVVFEVHPADGKKDEYLELAKHLKPILEKVDGFLDNERFESKRRQGWVLSLSTWRDEKALVRWRSEGEHHQVQAKGRGGVFSDYHLRVCEVTADNQPPDGMQVLQQRFDETVVGNAKSLTITELTPADRATFAAQPDQLPAHLGLNLQHGALLDYDIFESIYNSGKILLLACWSTEEDARQWNPSSFAGVAELRHRCVRVIRDYGMFERRESPQYYPEIDPLKASR